MKLKVLGLLAGLALLSTIGEASAAIVTDTYVGTVGPNSFDSSFGGDFSGDTFVATFTFDLSQAVSGSSNPERVIDSTLDEAINLQSTNFGIVSIQVNDHVSSIVGNYDTYDLIENSMGSTSINSFVRGENGYYVGLGNSLLPTTVISLSTTFSNIQNFYIGEGYIYDGKYSFFLIPGTVSQSVSNGVSAVPLPASLPMFASALFGIAGFGFWRKRRAGGAAMVAA